jgi:hypothetical protein
MRLLPPWPPRIFEMEQPVLPPLGDSPLRQDPPRRRSLSRRVKAFVEPRLMAVREHFPLERMLPDFIVIGARKCGTTYFYNNLVRQAGFLAAYKKEVDFFDKHYPRGAGWYRAHFPTRLAQRAAELVRGRPVMTGESTPLYLFHPRAPKRVRELLPDVKLIALLRNPTDRAYSHYEHQARRNVGAPTFEKALETEQALEADGTLPAEFERLKRDDAYVSEPRQVLSYLSGGIYVDQLAWWFEEFPAAQLLILKAEDMYRDSAAAIRRATEFLGGTPGEVRIVRENRKRGYPKMDAVTRRWLEQYFAPHNRRLYEFLRQHEPRERPYGFTPWE